MKNGGISMRPPSQVSPSIAHGLRSSLSTPSSVALKTDSGILVGNMFCALWLAIILSRVLTDGSP